jgi:phage-related minor tail protein
LAETIKGINVVIGAETTGLAKALSDVNKRSRDMQSELRQVERLLKLDPTNTELLAQKQKLLADSVQNTKQKLDQLRAVQEQVNQQFANGEISEGQYRAFQREIAKTEQELKGLEDKIDDTTDTLKEHSGVVEKIGKDYQESFEQAKQSMGNTFEQAKKLGAGITAVGGTIAAALGFAVKGAADFEQGMANAYSVMDPSEVSVFRDELEALAVQLGADTKYSATEAAKGIEELIKAGITVQDVLDGGLSGALSLATAGELELGDAAEIASTALNAFKDDAISVQDAADILAGAANASATSVSEMKFGLAQSSAVASSVGLTFKDTATALAVFAQSGLKGSDAGTSLKTMLMRLQPKTDEAYNEFVKLGLMTLDSAKAMEYLSKVGVKPASDSVQDITAALAGYMAKADGAKSVTGKYFKAAKEMITANGWVYSSFYDATGSLKDMDEIAGILNKQLSGLNDMQRQAALNTIFGSDAIRGANILYKEGAQGVNAMADAMSKIDAQTVAAQKMDTFKGAIEELSGSVETAQIAIGSALIPILRSLTGIVQKVVDMFNAMPQGMQQFIAISGAVVAALALITGPLLMLIGFLPQIKAGIEMVKGLSALTSVFSALTGPIGLTVAAIAALAAGLTYLYHNNETVREALNAAWEAIKSAAETIFTAIQEFWNTWGADITSFFKTTWDVIKSVFQTIITAISTVIKTIFGEIKAFWDTWGTTITQAFKNVFEILKTVFSTVFNAIFTTIKTVFAAIQAFWQTWGGVITNHFKTVFNVIKSVIEGVWNQIKNIIETAIGVITNVIKLFLSVLKGDWQGAWDAIKGIVDSVWTGIKNTFSNVGQTMMNIGKDIIKGLINGIKSMANAVVDTAKGIANSIGDSVKDFFGIHSPSRLMLGYGKNIMQGLSNGISDTAKQAVKAASNAANSVSSALTVDSSVGIGASGGAALSGAGGTVNNINLNGPFYVRSDQDIKDLAKEINDATTTAGRGLGETQ